MQNPRYKRFKAPSFTPTIFYFVKPESLICKFPSIWPELPYLAPGYDPFPNNFNMRYIRVSRLVLGWYVQKLIQD